MDRKGVTLSINMIIILIIALLTLVVAVGFITGFMQDLMDKVEGFPTLEIEPTADEPITFLPATVERGKDNKFTIGFYNNEQSTVDETVKPDISCQGISSVTVNAAGAEVPVGSTYEYATLVSVPSDTPAGQYSCSMTVSETKKSFFIEVE